ncbi:MAG: polysaccharide deacetylase family protein [Bacteroidales bacterium]
MLLIGLIILIFSFLVYASYSIGSGVYVKAYCRGKVTRRSIAITFDDGIDPIQTPRVLDVLHKYNVKATFFIIGVKGNQYPDLLKRIVLEGHLIGNHSYSHKGWFPFLSKDSIMRELQKTEHVLNSIGSHTQLFRPPFGVTNPTIGAAVRSLNYKVIGWSIRSFDTCNRPMYKTVARIKNRLNPGAILLLHDNRPQSDVLLEAVLLMLKELKYDVERVDTLLNMQ